MSSIIRDILKDFQQLDLNKDFKLDQDELKAASDPKDYLQFDSNSDGVVTVPEFLRSNSAYLSEKVARLFSDGLIARCREALKTTFFRDPYEAMFLCCALPPAYKFDERLQIYTLSMTVQFDEHLQKMARIIPELGLIGFSEAEIVDSVFKVISISPNDLKQALNALDSLEFSSENQKNEFLKKIVMSGGFSIYYIANYLKSAASFLKELNFLDFEIKSIVTGSPDVLEILSKIKSINGKAKLYSKEELRSHILSLRIYNRIQSLHIFGSQNFLKVVSFLRNNKVSDNDIKELIKASSVFVGAVSVFEAIPELYRAFNSIGLDPLPELKKRIVNFTFENDDAAFPIYSFSKNVEWLKKISTSKDKMMEAIDICFTASASFDDLKKLYESLEGIIPESEKLSWSLNIIKVKSYYSNLYNLSLLIDVVREMRAAPVLRKFFIEKIIERLPKISIPSAINVIQKMQRRGSTDEQILEIVGFLISNHNNSGLDYARFLIDFTERFGVYKDPGEFYTFLDAIYFEKTFPARTVFGFNSLKSGEQFNKLQNDPLWPEVVKEFQLNHLVEFFGFAYASGFFKDKCNLKDLVEACRWLLKNSITHFSRYSLAVVNKARNPVAREPKVVVQSPGHDHNGGFSNEGLDKIIPKVNVDLVEVYQEDELYAFLDKQKDDSIDVLILGGHGTGKSLAFSEGLPAENRYLDVTDVEFKERLKKMKNGSRIILTACSTGKELGDQIRKWAAEVGKDIEIIAPPTDVASELYIDDTGKVNVRYIDPDNDNKIVEGRIFKSGKN